MLSGSQFSSLHTQLLRASQPRALSPPLQVHFSLLATQITFCSTYFSAVGSSFLIIYNQTNATSLRLLLKLFWLLMMSLASLSLVQNFSSWLPVLCSWDCREAQRCAVLHPFDYCGSNCNRQRAVAGAHILNNKKWDYFSHSLLYYSVVIFSVRLSLNGQYSRFFFNWLSEQFPNTCEGYLIISLSIDQVHHLNIPVSQRVFLFITCTQRMPEKG